MSERGTSFRFLLVLYSALLYTYYRQEGISEPTECVIELSDDVTKEGITREAELLCARCTNCFAASPSKDPREL